MNKRVNVIRHLLSKHISHVINPRSHGWMSAENIPESELDLRHRVLTWCPGPWDSTASFGMNHGNGLMGLGHGQGRLLQHSQMRRVVETERKINLITLRTLVMAMSALVMCQVVTLEVGALDIVGWW